MNIDTGHLIDPMYMTEAEKARLTRLKGYITVPYPLQAEATMELDGKKEVFVDLRADTPLANWAMRERQKAKRRATAKRTTRRRMAKASTKINRRRMK